MPLVQHRWEMGMTEKQRIYSLARKLLIAHIENNGFSQQDFNQWRARTAIKQAIIFDRECKNCGIIEERQ